MSERLVKREVRPDLSYECLDLCRAAVEVVRLLRSDPSHMSEFQGPVIIFSKSVRWRLIRRITVSTRPCSSWYSSSTVTSARYLVRDACVQFGELILCSKYGIDELLSLWGEFRAEDGGSSLLGVSSASSASATSCL